MKTLGILLIANLLMISKLEARSTEWQLLPRQKSWEIFNIPYNTGVDALGFDKKSKITFHTKQERETKFITSSRFIKPLGILIGSKTPSNFLGLGDDVYIEAKNHKILTIQNSYAITKMPKRLNFKENDESAFAYPILGKVKILSKKDNIYAAQITSLLDTVKRGDTLLELPPSLKIVPPSVGKNNLTAEYISTKYPSKNPLAQYQEVFLNKGKEDLIEVGNLFHVFLYEDPSNEKTITSSDFIVQGSIQVIQVDEHTSLGMILKEKDPLKSTGKAILVTDASELKSDYPLSDHPIPDDDLDRLDNYDIHKKLGRTDREELKQLEKLDQPL